MKDSNIRKTIKFSIVDCLLIANGSAEPVKKRLEIPGLVSPKHLKRVCQELVEPESRVVHVFSVKPVRRVYSMNVIDYLENADLISEENM